jgi:hypothetical protein
MLSKGADPTVKDSCGDTALGLAASIGEIASMRLPLAKGDALAIITNLSLPVPSDPPKPRESL